MIFNILVKSNRSELDRAIVKTEPDLSILLIAHILQLFNLIVRECRHRNGFYTMGRIQTASGSKYDETNIPCMKTYKSPEQCIQQKDPLVILTYVGPRCPHSKQYLLAGRAASSRMSLELRSSCFFFCAVALDI